TVWALWLRTVTRNGTQAEARYCSAKPVRTFREMGECACALTGEEAPPARRRESSRRQACDGAWHETVPGDCKNPSMPSARARAPRETARARSTAEKRT